MYLDMGDYFKKMCFHISFIFRKNNIYMGLKFKNILFYFYLIKI